MTVKKMKWPYKVLITLVAIILACVVMISGLNNHMITIEKGKIVSKEEAVKLTDVDCILVLGCGVESNGAPSVMLADRLKVGISLYQEGVATKLLMSGDHGQSDYDEVNTMKEYAILKGVPSEDIFMDHAGFSTYDSIYRAKSIFDAKKVIIVTQKYHLYRALYIAEKLGLEAFGVSADLRDYSGQTYRDLREIFARNKDLFNGIFKPEPTYLGDVIPVNGNGDATNDKESKESK